MAKINILLIEDEEFDARRVQNTLKLMEDKIEIKEIVSNGNDALEVLKKKKDEYDIIIMDFQIAGGLRGEELIKQIKKIDSTLQIIVITKLTIDMTDFEFANRLIDAGAFWYCTKYPGDIEKYIYQPTDFLMSIFNAYEKKKLEWISYNSNKKSQLLRAGFFVLTNKLYGLTSLAFRPCHPFRPCHQAFRQELHQHHHLLLEHQQS